MLQLRQQNTQQLGLPSQGTVLLRGEGLEVLNIGLGDQTRFTLAISLYLNRLCYPLFITGRL
ncbi:MAG: hypothetical protein AAGF98_13185 [Cyanobacteria bacterium P01_H01_bin.153]